MAVKLVSTLLLLSLVSFAGEVVGSGSSASDSTVRGPVRGILNAHEYQDKMSSSENTSKVDTLTKKRPKLDGGGTCTPIVKSPVASENMVSTPPVVSQNDEDVSKPSNKCISQSTKRDDYISWDDYFMSVAFLSAMRSKDPSTQVGACIVNPDKRIVGIGYNGFPRGCSDDVLPWARVPKEGGSELDTKYPYVTHAEVNAILNKCSADVVGSTMYVALFPCNECAKVIIQAGIAEVVYMSDKYHDTDSCRASRKMFELSGVKTRQHKPQQRQITIDFGPHLN